MVLAVGSLLNIVNKMGGIDLMSNALAKIMTKGTATPFMGISAALLSLVSSALGVVYPTMMPMCADIAAQVGGVNPVALMAAVGAGGSLSGISPLSTGGALAMAALATALPQPHQGGREQDVRAAVHLRRPCDPDPDRALLDHLRPAGKPAAWRLIPGNV